MRQFACLQRAAARIAGKAGSFQTCGRLKCLQIALPCTVQGEHQVSRMRIGQTSQKGNKQNAGVGPMPPPSIGGDGLALICMPRALPMHEAAPSSTAQDHRSHYLQDLRTQVPICVLGPSQDEGGPRGFVPGSGTWRNRGHPKATK